ncbi:hypothetical protein GCM10010401_08480 [Rarobacter faecitabidus]|uniref:Antirestriction protein ArdA n=1 Tax=Rarobacter faecitabidus TaxID=13243 RepID=A0A542ZAT6_RARFA|nr:antirestriction protein ArdA [Rarobacter faecitabidus]TQL57453.1 antirestriction protein ArdA [Rarobacter faecitabidus]
MTTTTPATETTPSAWIGCLACYNAGRLVGDWFDAISADEVTTYDIHGAHSRADSHDELWVMDHENIPVSGEMRSRLAACGGSSRGEVDCTGDNHVLESTYRELETSSMSRLPRSNPTEES